MVVGSPQVSQSDVDTRFPTGTPCALIDAALHVGVADIGAEAGCFHHVEVQALGQHRDGVVRRVVEFGRIDERLYRDARLGSTMLPWSAEVCLERLGRARLYS